jgi:hypothetical protein
LIAFDASGQSLLATLTGISEAGNANCAGVDFTAHEVKALAVNPGERLQVIL